MKLSMLALIVIFVVSAWLPYAAPQTSTPEAAPQSRAASPAPRNGLANSTCAPVTTQNTTPRRLPAAIRRTLAAMAMR